MSEFTRTGDRQGPEDGDPGDVERQRQDCGARQPNEGCGAHPSPGSRLKPLQVDEFVWVRGRLGASIRDVERFVADWDHFPFLYEIP